MKCITSLATIAAVGLLAACTARTVDPGPGQPPEASSSSPSPSPSPTPGPTGDPSVSATKPRPPADVTLDVDANLRALRELQVFEVSAVVATSSAEQKNCYGGPPCPIELAEFTRTALAAVADAEADARIESDGTCYRTDEQNLQALKELRGVAIGELVLEKPESFDNCYHVPRAHKLARIAAALRNKP